MKSIWMKRDSSKIVMTFTDTACDCAESLPIEFVTGLKQIEGIKDINVEITCLAAWINQTNQSLTPY